MANPLDLPTAKKERQATYKDPPHDPEFLPAIVRAWAEVVLPPQRNREMAVPGRRVRASQMGIPCDLALRYAIDGEPETDPPSIADEYRMMVGTMVHDAIEAHIRRAFPDAEVEVKVDLMPDLDGSATVDILIIETRPDDSEHRTVIELKTVGGYQFKLMAAPFRGGPKGPRTGAIHQAALGARALDADMLVVGYLSLELISADLAMKMGVDDLGKFTAEWRYDRAEIAVLANEAETRFKRVLAESDARVITEARVWDGDLGGGGVVEPPGSGVVRMGGKTIEKEWWGCDYCRHRTRCREQH